ncbi:MAG: hypothetical protein WEC75_00070 [Dehalococcoidia bacterium]
MSDPADVHNLAALFARPTGRRSFLRGVLSSAAGGAAVYAFGCDGGSGGGEARREFTTRLLTQEYTVGQVSRVAVGVLDEDLNLLRDARIHARFFTIQADGRTGTLRGEGEMTFTELNLADIHAHDASSEEDALKESVSFYVATTIFDVPGAWGMELTTAPSDLSDQQTLRVAFNVLDQSRSPAIDSIPPASQTDTVATNPNASSLCSRDPICELHDRSIADLLGKGRPLVVQFSTPAFCETRFCGPVLEVLLSKVPEYRDRIDFLHIEVWQDFQLQKYRPAVQEWDLPGEPYTFFMDGQGRVAGKLEAVFSEEELVAQLERVLAGPPAG